MTATNYQALARKHRPQTFEDIVGQQHVTRTLQKAIKGGRVHHAYLFAGIRGIGKTTAARVLAKALNCANGGPTPTPCNECVSCKEITDGRSMDVMEIDAASNRGIDDIRELREGVRYTTARDRFKMVIIDEVHMLTEQAFNALLKTLEEPPPHVRFILATTDPQKIPATILSRCQRFDFRRVLAADLISHLASICQREGVSADEEALAVIVRQTQGSVRDSMSLLDQLIAAGEGQVTADWAKQILGVCERRWVIEALQAILASDAKAALLVLREVYRTGYDIKLFVRELMQCLRDAMVLAVSGASKELVDLSESEIKEIRTVIDGVNPYDLHYYLREMLASVENMRQSEFPLFTAEESLVRACSAGQTLRVAQLAQRLADLETRLGQSLQKPELFAAAPALTAPPAKSYAPTAPVATAAHSPAPEPSRKETPAAVVPAATRPAAPPAKEEEPVPEDEPPLPGETPEHAESGAAGTSEEESALDVMESADEEAAEEPIDGPAIPDAAGKGPEAAAKQAAPYPAAGGFAKADPATLDPRAVWEAFVDFLQGSGRLIDAASFRECVLTNLTKTRAMVRVPRNLGELLEGDVDALFQEFMGRKMTVKVEETDGKHVDESLASGRRKRIAEKKLEMASELKSDPLVARALELFPGAKVGKVLVDEPRDTD